MVSRSRPGLHGSGSVPPPKRAIWPALLTFLLGLSAALALAWMVVYQDRHSMARHFDRHAEHVTAEWRQNLQSAAALLRGTRAATGSDQASARADLARFLRQSGAVGPDAPVRSLGWLHAAAQDGTGSAFGVSRYTSLLEPGAAETDETALANDAPTQRALRQAADTGQAALAVHASDVDPADTASSLANGWALYLPVYATSPPPAAPAARRAAVTGFLVATLDARRLFERSDPDRRAGDMTILAGDPPVPVHIDNRALDAPDDKLFHHTDRLNFGGIALTLRYRAERVPALIRTDTTATIVFLAAFAAVCLLTALVDRLAVRASAAAVRGGLLDEARMLGIVRSSMEAIITIDESQTVVIFNPAAERVFGVSAMDAVGAPLERFIPARFRAAHAKHVEQFGVTGVSERQMGRQRLLFGLRANGEEFPIEASISQIHDRSGKLYTVMLRDVTERVRGDDALRRSREELRELSANLQQVREEEKTRIARELHDDLGQQLTALKMDVSVIAHALSRFRTDPPDAPRIAAVERQLQNMRRLIDSTVASVRRIAADLRPVMLDDLGPVPAIEWLADDFTHRYGIGVLRDIDIGEIALSNSAATTLFRVVQEALTNVARHAEATEVKLILRIESGFCLLRIVDNGRGMPEAANDGTTFGLLGIRERAHMLSGTVSIDSMPGHGVSVTVTLPLHAVQQEGGLP